jgi:PAS domain S-box-containing protein
MAAESGIHRRIVESAPEGVWVVDADGRTVFANAHLAELLGRTADELTALTFADVLVAEDRADFDDRLRALVAGAADRRAAERTFRRSDGTTVALLVSDMTLYDDDGTVLGYLHRLADDSRRRSLVAELSRSRSQLADAQDIARMGSWEIEVEPYRITWSEQMYTLFGLDPSSPALSAERFIDLAVPADRAALSEAWRSLPAVTGPLVLDARFTIGDGSERWMRTTARVLERDAAGGPVRFGGTVQDIDELKRTERQLRDAVETNTLMQFMASAANETSSVDEALSRLRELLLADRDWVRGVAFTVEGAEVAWRPLGPDDRDLPIEAEHVLAARALRAGAPVFDEETVPGHLLVGFPVVAGGAAVVVVVVTAVSSLPHRASVSSVVAQVASQLAQVADREALVGELSRSRSQLAEAQAIAGVGSWEMEAAPPHTSTCSEHFYVVLDVDPETWTPGLEPFLGQLVEDDREPLLEAFARALVEPGEHMVDVRARMRDGSVRWLRTVGQVLEWSVEGEPVRLGGTVQDINDLKETEFRLRDAVELNTLMQFIATAANETSTLDEALAKTGELLLAHPDWETGVAFDVTEAGLEFRPVGPRSDPPPTDVERAVAERTVVQAGPVLEEQALPGTPLIGFPVVLQGETVAVVVITARSPFERHEMMKALVTQVGNQLAQVAGREIAARQLAEARDLAMAASFAKSEFLATMSHEIRTPLNGVIGLNDLLLRTDLDAHQRQLAEAMQGAGHNLLALISDVLDFSRIEAGGLELEAVAFQPAVAVRGTVELFAPMADAKGVRLDLEIDESVPSRLEGDPSRFGQVVSNVVANAVKFTHEGSVHVRVSATTSGRDTTLRVDVRDTGIGMSPEQLGRVFQPFRQADASTTRTFGGTGLGLAIAHRLATALGGEIGVESTPGEGSAFWVTGQFRIPEAPARVVPRASAAGDQAGNGGHVLVVEDNEVNQLVAVGMLEVLGYTSEVAADGAAAAARAAGGRFDAVLMDLQMPRLDGFAATRLIRQAEPPGVRIPIVALTASATPGEQERCLEAGMTGFLSKPVSAEALGRVLSEQLTGQAVAVVPPVVGPRLGRVLAHTSTSRSASPVLDPSRLEELAEMGAASFPLIQRAIDHFVDDAADSARALLDQLGAGDATALRSSAHRLKGSAANLGAARVAELALEVELLAEDGRLAEAAPVVDRLHAALDEATGALRDYRLDAGSVDESCTA